MQVIRRKAVSPIWFSFLCKAKLVFVDGSPLCVICFIFIFKYKYDLVSCSEEKMSQVHKVSLKKKKKKKRISTLSKLETEHKG